MVTRGLLQNTVIGCLGVLIFVSPILGQSVTITPVKDNTLYETPAGNLSNGAGSGVFTGRTNQGANDRRRGLFMFDVAGNVPAGATITSVTLQLRQSQGNSFTHTHSIHRLLADWGEAGSVSSSGGGGMGGGALTGDATWTSNFLGSSTWTTQGGDFDPTVSGSAPVMGFGFYTWGSTAGMVADVQSWLDTPASNFGWIMIGNEGAAGSAKRFDTREIGVAANRPQLTIDFVVAGGPGACCLAGGTCQTLDEANCNSMSGDYQGAGIACDPNPCPPPIPAASTWTTIAMTMLVLCAGTVIYRRNTPLPSIE